MEEGEGMGGREEGGGALLRLGLGGRGWSRGGAPLGLTEREGVGEA